MDCFPDIGMEDIKEDADEMKVDVESHSHPILFGHNGDQPAR